MQWTPYLRPPYQERRLEWYLGFVHLDIYEWKAYRKEGSYNRGCSLIRVLFHPRSQCVKLYGQYQSMSTQDKIKKEKQKQKEENSEREKKREKSEGGLGGDGGGGEGDNHCCFRSRPALSEAG